MGGLQSTAEKAPPSPKVVLDPRICKTTPDIYTGKPSADHNYGFEGKQRKEREMIATAAELESAMVPRRFRDYCAHKFILFEKCKRDKFPFVYRCHPEKHAMEVCQLDDIIIRMKEYERDRRLLHRRARKEAKAAKAAAAANADCE